MEDRVCIALDVEDIRTALNLVKVLAPRAPIFKVGSHLYAGGEGKRIIEEIHRMGAKIFLDLKFHDIPNTVANAARVATKLGVHMLNVHALGGSDMMKAAVEAVADESIKKGVAKPKVLAITVLTSISKTDLSNDLLVNEPINSYIAHLASLAEKAGLDGVVCSAHEIIEIRRACESTFILVTPGIRPVWFLEKHDQKRVMTANEALKAGADYIVVGRPIIQADSPLDALDWLLEELND
jgi:orotidine-5'-phosphate decarboxylase